MLISRRSLVTLLTVGMLTVSVVVSAQTRLERRTPPPANSAGQATADTRAPEPPRPPAPTSQVFSDGDLDQLYRDLYGVQMKLGRGTEADLDSLRAVRDALLVEIRALGRQIEEEKARRQAAAPDQEWEEDFDDFVTELEDAAVDSDWERLAELVAGQAEVWGEGLALLGNELKGMQVEIDEDRVRIDTGSGSRFTFNVPDEVKEEMHRGFREVGIELSKVLDDSMRMDLGRELEGLFDELPDDVGNTLFGRRRSREKTVIPESIYRFGEDVIVERDEIVQGDVLVVRGDAFVEGDVEGNVYVLAGDLFVEGDGSIAYDAVSLGGRVRVDDDSRVHGRRIAPNLAAPGVLPMLGTASGGLAWIMHWSRVAMLALLVVVAFHVAEGRMRRLTRHGEAQAGRDLATGALWFSVILGVFVVASVGLVISVIGIPVVLVLVAGFGLVALLAYAVGCHVLGERLLERFGSGGDVRAWQAALLGLALLELPALLALAFTGVDPGGSAVMGLRGLDILVKFAAVALGFGAIVATRGGLEVEETATPAPELVLPSGTHDD